MRVISMLLLSLLCSLQALAQGTIAGKVTDEKTGEALIGITVRIQNGSMVMTEVDGSFSLHAPSGVVTLEVSGEDYQQKNITGVEVKTDMVANVDITLRDVSRTALNEVVVTASVNQQAVAALYTQQKNAATATDGISAEVMRRSPDRSVGEAMKRVSGTTIQDNKFVIVRGLSDRYNTALVDNSILPSTEPNRKAFSFDIIPASLIDNIVISKTATPDLPGDFAGGVISITTREMPEQNFASVTLSGSYNSASVGREFRSGFRSSTDILGFDGGARQLPAGIPSASYLQRVNLSAEQSATCLGTLNSNFSITNRTALPGAGLQASLGRTYRFGSGARAGFTAALTYGHNEIVKRDLRRQYDNFDYTDNAYQYNSAIGAMLNGGIRYGKSKIVFKSLYNRLFEDQFLYREGVNIGGPRDIQYYAFDLVQKSLTKLSLEGDHGMGAGKLNWIAAYNIVTNNQPDQRKVSYSRTAGTSEPFMADNTTVGKSNNRLFGNLTEHIANAGLNYSQPINIFNASSIKFGIFGQYRYRDFDNRYLGARLESGAADEVQVRTRPIESLYSADVVRSGHYTLVDQTVPGDRYTAHTNTAAAYAMLDNRFSDQLRFVWGARVESFGLDLTAGGKTTSKRWTDLLPSANLIYALSDKSNLRGSYFRSLARPEIREVAGDLFYYDYELNANFLGNYSLERTSIHNADLRFELFPGAGEILSVSAFYKRFQNPIENQINGQGSSYEIKPVNYLYAQNIGLELEVRKNLGFLSDSTGFLRNLSVYANLSLVSSKVPVTGADQYVNNHQRDQRPLSGQSPYVINTSLSYAAGNLTFSALYNRIGQRIYLVGQGRFADVYESPRNLLDFQVAWNISKSSELRVNFRDLLNSPVQYYFDQDGDKRFGGTEVSGLSINANKDWLLQRYRPGQNVMVSYVWKM